MEIIAKNCDNCQYYKATILRTGKHYCLAELNPKKGTHQYTYDRGNGRKTTYIHYVDGMEIWELNPDLWRGWKLMHTIIAERGVF